MAFQDPVALDGLDVTGDNLRAMIHALAGGRQGVAGPSTSLAVSAQASPTNTVRAAAGWAVVNSTASGEPGSYTVYNDASLTSPTISSTAAQVRTDRIVLRITAGVPALQVIAGTAGSATPPTITGDNVIPLARVELPVSTTNITNAMIIDERQWVTGGLAVASVASLLPSSPPDGTLAYITGAERPSGSGVVVPHSSVPAAPGLWQYDNRWNPPWNMPWGLVGWAKATANEAGFTTEDDLNSLTVTYTAAGQRFTKTRVVLPSLLQVAGGGLVTLTIADGSNVQKAESYFRPTAGQDFHMLCETEPEVHTAGSITRKGRLTAASSTDLFASSAFPSLIEIIDLGPAGPPS